MNKRQAKRLLNVARALRESPDPKVFDMGSFVNDPFDLEARDIDPEQNPHFCGTPACALGHYGSRTDLQRVVKIVKERVPDVLGRATYDLRYRNNMSLGYDKGKLNDHFGLNSDEMDQLFGHDGCGNAKTARQAAQYIEKFVKRAYGSLPI